MAVRLLAGCFVGSLCLNIVTAQNVTEDDDVIVFPGGDEIDAIIDIIKELVESEESTSSPSNISSNSFIRTTGKIYKINIVCP